MSVWSASQYLKFEDERTRPARDLLSGVALEAPRQVVDMGCGPGNSTELLVARYPEAAISGLDSSPEMLVEARRRLSKVPFAEADATTWTPATQPDLIFANAVLQWVPNHKAVMQGLMDKLAPGGSLAVQIPANLAEPAQTLMRDVAANGPWAQKLKDADTARTDRHEADWYYRELKDSAKMLDIWKTIYYHPLSGASAIVEWFKSTGLRPFLDPLEADEKAEFLKRYEDAVAKAHPALPDGTVLLPFPRLFIIATR